MSAKTLSAFLLLISFSAQAQQTGPFNQYNLKHKKQGLWKVYFTDHLVATADSAQAAYCGYDYYDNGQRIVETSSSQGYKKEEVVKMEHEGDLPQTGKPILLNGTFTFYDRTGPGLKEQYRDGMPVLITLYYHTAEGAVTATETLDYTQSYQGQFGSYRYEKRDQNNKTIEGWWFRKNANGKWK